MRLAVVGSRGFNDYELLKATLDTFSGITIIVSGGAYGADKLAERYAKDNGIPTHIIKPDWVAHGKAAGFIRNKLIWDNCDAGVAFWDGESKGTAHSFKLAEQQNKTITIIKYKENYD